jgi:translation initiation factor IF-2
VLVKRGTLKTGSIIVAGENYCKVRTLKDDAGKNTKIATPGTPVEVLGWKSLPEAGDEVLQAESENQAKLVIENRQARADQLRHVEDIAAINERRRQWQLERSKEEERQARLKAGLDVGEESTGAEVSSTVETVNIIVKADVSGSAEAVSHSISGLGNDRVTAKVISSGVGEVTESDVKLAETANATIVTFNLKTAKDAYTLAGRLNVKILNYTVIYRLLEDITQMLTSKLAPVVKHRVLAEAELRDVFTFTLKNKSKLQIAGVKVANGTLSSKDKVRVLRNKEVVFDGRIDSMKHHKDEVSETKKGSECGITFAGWTNFQTGDLIQTYEAIEIQQHL